ncbi:hypothetical protein SAMN04488569_104819 [Marinilactibacillus piezotolerans]|uniref:Uncharacterized protein n=1 Tax=Marinilactibacillus piezotolerans TaxID=258723 RepID=A0A1I4AFI5_9LACT|nr:hypothetical protein [Marinilactibacillus piezotolerans]SFK55178.1 hypothetical protein SAMN04488569_104819 [Marinilactibacillus piezotolerans]
MNKSTFSFLFNGIFVMSIILMFWGLFSSVLPRYSGNSRSMIIGTILYTGLALLAWLVRIHSTLPTKFLILTSLGLAGIHIYSEIQLLTSIGLFAITNMLGYTALITLGLALSIKFLNNISKNSLASLSLNGLLTTAVTFTYWHVASINLVRESLLFFIPFSFLFFLTIGQFAFKFFRERNLLYDDIHS